MYIIYINRVFMHISILFKNTPPLIRGQNYYIYSVNTDAICLRITVR